MPGITEGEYKEMPNDVVSRYGEYYTDGTVPSHGYYSGGSRSSSGDGRRSDSSSSKEEDVDTWVKRWMEEN